MRKRISSYKKAFTLIEIMIGTIIIGVIVAIGIASYNNFNEQKQVEKAANELKGMIRLASSKARNNEKNCTVCGGCIILTDDDDPLDGWFVDLSNVPPTIYGSCDSNHFGTQTIAGLDSSFQISSSVTILKFYSLTENKQTNLLEELIITISKGSYNKQIIVDPSGNVY